MAKGRKTSVVIDITLEQREILTAWQRSTIIRAGLAKRGRIILMLADGASAGRGRKPFFSTSHRHPSGADGVRAA